MKVTINDNIILYDSIEVFIDSFNLVREFTLVDKSDKKNYNVGDKIKIETEDELVLLEGTIDGYNVIKSTYTYKGRSNTRALLYYMVPESKRFSKNTEFHTILKSLTSDLDIKIIGSSAQLKQDDIIINAGSKLSRIISDLATLFGTRIVCGPNNELYLNPEPKQGNINFEKGKNIKISKYVNLENNMYNKYVIKSFNGEGSESYGSGENVYSYFYNYNLNADECKRIAKIKLLLDKKENISYIIIMDNLYSIDINTLHEVEDNDFNIRDTLVTESLFYHYSNKGGYIQIKLGFL